MKGKDSTPAVRSAGTRPRPHARAGTATIAAATLLAAGLVAGTTPAQAETTESAGGYSAEIRRTSYGVPHVTARNFASLGFGAGYVQAEENICVIAEKVVTADAARSRYFGATESNVGSDLFFQKAKEDKVAEGLLAGTPDGVAAPSREVRDLVRGFAAGYNNYLRKTGVAKLTDPQCRDKPWVRQINALDLWRTNWANMIRSGTLELLRPLLDTVAPAPGSAPSPTLDAGGPGTSAADPGSADAAEGNAGGLGSNAYGLGSAATVSGGGMLLANPHFPWDGPDRFYRIHLKIPGSYDVEGASLLGDPIVQIGHNASMGWSHTVSTALRHVWHELKLVPGDPTSYLVDGKPEKMTQRTVTVRVPTPTGGTEPVTHTFYDTRFGPVIASPTFPWTTSTAYAMTDINADNGRALDGWLQLGRAKTVRAAKTILDRYQFLPWVNIVAADAAGEALYGDHSVVPRVTDELAATCIPARFRTRYAESGEAVLDGSTSACGLGADPDAAVPGILGPAHLPVLIRTDYVTNSNNSHWLANPEQPLTGFPRIIGDEQTERGLRTRLGVRQVQQRLAGTDGLPGTRFTTENLWQVQFGNRVYGGELVRDDLVALCTANPSATASNGATVDLTAACAALRGWDLRANLDSRGAHLFNEFNRARGLVFRDPFVVTDPVNTPRVLAADNPRVLTALADAVQRLAGVPLDAPLGEVQTEPRGGEQIPIHGGPGGSGIFNAINSGLTPGVGYPKVNYGTSFVMAVEFGRHGPSGRQILTYSQSTNPNSPYYADQTRLYSQKGWDTIKYTEAQISADPNLRTYRVRGNRHDNLG
ncbi:penicillin acylase family protein [Micromonospora polyrhachis]|uniref:Acyl-homoserine-lactone acylase n=1 Tax=Micromonospora polyrhachis TaxID=1282883 RepID=A0A7W7WRE1_9ACTN|nr:acylase [Micromonospora polyrhachis]MBB4960213.1 acyl-homoserine-lactone acylase [Micromonospora polyrhachis]